MQLDEKCLLCNPQFHERFCKTTEVLALVLAAAPFSMSLEELLDKTNLVSGQLLAICHALRRAGFIRRHDVFPANWVLGMSASHLTLEDVFFCVARQFADDTPARVAGSDAVAASTMGGVDAFLMQASIATYQSFLKELRRFSLARLRTGVPARPDEEPIEHRLLQDAMRVMAEAEAP